jgi:hypothetical protein
MARLQVRLDLRNIKGSIQMKMGHLVVLALATSFIATACATSSGRAAGEIARARTLIEQAEKAGAQRYAAAELDKARNRLQLAAAADEAGKEKEARARANEAAADAELALARTHSGEAKNAAEEVRKATEALQQESARKTTASGTSPE